MADAARLVNKLNSVPDIFSILFVAGGILMEYAVTIEIPVRFQFQQVSEPQS